MLLDKNKNVKELRFIIKYEDEEFWIKHSKLTVPFVNEDRKI